VIDRLLKCREHQRGGMARWYYYEHRVLRSLAGVLRLADEVEDIIATKMNEWDSAPEFFADGRPLFSLTLGEARMLAALKPHVDGRWHFPTSTMLIDIVDEGCLYARSSTELVSVVALDETSTLLDLLNDNGRRNHLLANLAYLMANPEGLQGWTLRQEHAPSLTTSGARNRNKHEEPYPPGTLWVLGTTRNLSDIGRQSESSERGEKPSGPSRKWKVRTWVKAHERLQAYGPKWSKRRPIQIPGHEAGNPDAPVNVRATRLA
jgi:hypothetical protein